MIDFDAITRKREEVRRRQKAVATLRDRATDISVHISGMPRGGSGGNQQEQIRIELVAAQEAESKAEAELKELLRPLRKKLRKLEGWQYAAVLRKRYIEGKTVQQVADEIGYEWRQTCRYLDRAKALINKG